MKTNKALKVFKKEKSFEDLLKDLSFQEYLDVLTISLGIGRLPVNPALNNPGCLI